MIDGVVVRRPKVFKDDRGSVTRFLRTDDDGFAGFGEVYFSTVNPGVIKGWKRHREMTMTLTCPQGRVLLVLQDDRPNSPTQGQVQEILFTPDEPLVVSIPPMLWNGFMGLADVPSLVSNCASILHRPDEADTRPIAEPMLPYDWPEFPAP